MRRSGRTTATSTSPSGPERSYQENCGQWFSDSAAKFGKDVEKLLLGAVGIYAAAQKIRTGLQQLMAGSRDFNLSTITRRDLMSLSGEKAGEGAPAPSTGTGTLCFEKYPGTG